MDIEAYEAKIGIVPICIRPNIIIRIENIPRDLSEKEAEKICNVINALAIPITTTKSME